MYAVIETGGKQYRVQPGTVVQVEKLEAEVGKAITFDQILMLSAAGGAEQPAKIWLGKPYVGGAKVEAEVVGQGRDEKVMIVKMKRRKQYRRTQGHRQYQTQLLVTAVDTGAGDSAKLTAEEKKAKLAKFHTNLAPKGLASTPKTLGSRKRLAAARAEQAKAAPKKAAKK